MAETASLPDASALAASPDEIWRGYYIEATQRGMLMAQENAALREENARLLVENSRLRQDVAWYKHLGESGR